MDIGGVNRIRSNPLAATNADVRRNQQSATDKDTQGQGYSQNHRGMHLAPEQEKEALEKLNALPAFQGAGLRAELVREVGAAPHIVVKDGKGEVVRHLPYEQIVEIYINRNSAQSTGRLLKSAA